MTTAERRISQLEKLLKKEKETNRDGHNDYKIGYTEFELSQLYKLSGIYAKSKEMLNEAYSILHDPYCKKGKRTDKLLGLISFCISNPGAPPLVQLPSSLRYLSPLIMLGGYVTAYISYFVGLLSFTNFFIALFGVFVASMFATGIVSSSYARRMRRDYGYNSSYVPGSTEMKQGNGVRTPDDVVDDARAELALADMFYSTKNFKEMKFHLEKAKVFLSDPVSSSSGKKDQAILSLSKLEDAVKLKGILKE
jgi:tetratricopeptide (TPR) repeat protein